MYMASLFHRDVLYAFLNPAKKVIIYLLIMITVNIHDPYFSVEKGFATFNAKVILDFHVNSFKMNVQLGFIVELFHTLLAEFHLLSFFSMHRRDVGFQGIFSCCNKVTIRSITWKLFP